MVKSIQELFSPMKRGRGLGWVGLGWDLLVVGESDGVSGRSN